MAQPARCAVVSSLLLALVASVPVSAQIQPAGSERKLTRGASQPIEACPAIQALSDGSFLVLWSLSSPVAEHFACPSGSRILGRRLSAAGEPLGAPFVVALAPNLCVSDLRLGPEIGGRLVASWRESHGQLGTPISVAASVSPEGEAREVLRASHPSLAAVVPLRSGGLLSITSRNLLGRSPVTTGLDAQLLDAGGAPAGPKLTVTRRPGIYRRVVAAETSPGIFVVAWSVDDTPLLLSTVFARRLDAAGRFLGPVFSLTAPRIDFATTPSVAGSEDGRFAVVWAGGEDDRDAFGRFYGADGAPDTAVFRINASSNGTQMPSDALLTASGELIVLWDSARIFTGESDVVARAFDAEGNPLGKAFPLQAQPAGTQFCGKLAGDGQGGWLATWLKGGGSERGSELFVRPLTGAGD